MNRAATSESSKTEREIEKLVEEIDRVIQQERPDQRQELRMYASSLIADMTAASSAQPSEPAAKSERRPFGLVAGGLALLVVGGGFALIIPPIGMLLVFLGIALAIWGAIAGWWMTPKRDV